MQVACSVVVAESSFPCPSLLISAAGLPSHPTAPHPHPHPFYPTQDVDGFHPQNIGALAMRGRDPLFVSCTPKGCLELLKRSGVQMSGKRAAVVGRSNIVGMPAAMLLQREDATVTVIHSRTPDAQKICAEVSRGAGRGCGVGMETRRSGSLADWRRAADRPAGRLGSSQGRAAAHCIPAQGRSARCAVPRASMVQQASAVVLGWPVGASCRPLPPPPPPRPTHPKLPLAAPRPTGRHHHRRLRPRRDGGGRLGEAWRRGHRCRHQCRGCEPPMAADCFAGCRLCAQLAETAGVVATLAAAGPQRAVALILLPCPPCPR